MKEYVTELLGRKLPPERAAEVARLLTTGTWTHARPLRPAELGEMGPTVRIGVEEEERTSSPSIPSRGRTSQVEYAPGSAPPPERSRRRGRRRPD
jgi:Serine dehydrogenase proteinase